MVRKITISCLVLAGVVSCARLYRDLDKFDAKISAMLDLELRIIPFVDVPQDVTASIDVEWLEWLRAKGGDGCRELATKLINCKRGILEDVICRWAGDLRAEIIGYRRVVTGVLFYSAFVMLMVPWAQRSRWRSSLKGGLAVICVFLTLVWWASTRWELSYQSQERTVGIGLGCCDVWTNDLGINWPDEFLGLHLGPRSPMFRTRWWFRGGDQMLPLWVPLLAAAIPTILVWYRDCRPRAGYCLTCGYNLTGNISGVCPECGTPIRSATRTS